MSITLGSVPMTVLDPQKADVARQAAQHATLLNAAQEFEGMLLQQMLKGMQTGKDGESGDESADGSTDTLRSYGIEAVAHAIAKGGGVGIARQIVQKVTIERARDAQR